MLMRMGPSSMLSKTNIRKIAAPGGRAAAESHYLYGGDFLYQILSLPKG